jgi:hypothetical protein
MNTDFLLFNLREAQDEIEKTIRDRETYSDYGEPEFSVAMMHLYHHVNTAWNARNSSPNNRRIVRTKSSIAGVGIRRTWRKC